MRYHTKKPDIFSNCYGITYKCNHLVYNRCTLYLIYDKGLAVIQQRYNKTNKTTYWTEIDPWLNNIIYTNRKFKDYFDRIASKPVNGIYPTVTIRQIMWALRMKPLKKNKWETVFDRNRI